MSLRWKGLKGQQRRHALFTDVTDVNDDVMLSAVRGERRHGYGNSTPRQRQKQPPRQRTIASGHPPSCGSQCAGTRTVLGAPPAAAQPTSTRARRI